MKNILMLIGLVAVIAWTQKTNSISVFTTDPHEMYASTVKPLMETKCAPCHIPDKGGFKTSFDNYDSSAKYIAGMIVRVQLDPADPKYMPFKNKRPALTPEELAALKKWKTALDENSNNKKPE